MVEYYTCCACIFLAGIHLFKVFFNQSSKKHFFLDCQLSWQALFTEFVLRNFCYFIVHVTTLTFFLKLAEFHWSVWASAADLSETLWRSSALRMLCCQLSASIIPVALWRAHFCRTLSWPSALLRAWLQHDDGGELQEWMDWAGQVCVQLGMETRKLWLSTTFLCNCSIFLT